MAAANLPPDLSLVEQDIGRIREQLNQVSRVRRAFEMQDQLTQQVKELETAERTLSAEIDKETPGVDYESLSNWIEDGMNNYLNALNQTEPQRWEHGPVIFRFRERDFFVKVKGRRWDTQIGAASKAIVLFAYHYALLSLVHIDQTNYPGLVLIDFPLQLADGTSISDKENYLVEPFVALCESLGKGVTQFIAAGRSFENLTGAKRIVLARHPEEDTPVVGYTDE